MVCVVNPRISVEVRTLLLGTCRYRSAPRWVKCGKYRLPVGVIWNADTLEGFDAYVALAVVIALHAGEPS
jgi:hypothetical protein